MPDSPKPLTAFLTEAQIEELPDQRGLRSWAFEPHLELHHNEANVALGCMLQNLRESWLQDLQRRPSPSRQSNFVRCLRVILLNLMRVKTVDAALTVGIPSNKERLNRERHYRPPFMSVHYHLKALKLLRDSSAILMVKAGHQQEDYAETARYVLTERACNALSVFRLTVQDLTMGRRDEVILLRDAEHRLTTYTDTPETWIMRKNLSRLNDLLECTDISTTRPANPLADFDDEYNGQKTDLYRVFNNGSFEKGGRFYGGWWQHAKKHLRRQITIDGQSTVEADFKGLHPAILFAKQRLPIPLDPYALVPGIAENDTLRGHAKTTFLALLNAGDGGTKEPRDFDSATHGITKAAFQQAVKDAFPMLPGIFGTGIGLRLQREDSDMAERIMLHFAERDIPVLTVHDSFIIAVQYRDELVDVMQRVFRDTYGQVPVITLVGNPAS